MTVQLEHATHHTAIGEMNSTCGFTEAQAFRDFLDDSLNYATALSSRRKSAGH